MLLKRPVWPFSASFIGLSRQLRVDCWISSLVIDPERQLTDIRSVQRQGTDVDAPGDGMSYTVLLKTDSQLL